MIVFTDGADHYSRYTFPQVLDAAARSSLPVYIVGFPGDDSRSWSEQGRREIRNQFEQLTAVSGGGVFYPGSETDCPAIARQILQRARFRYRLGFYSSQPLNSLIDVEVRLRGDRRNQLTISASRCCDGGL